MTLNTVMYFFLTDGIRRCPCDVTNRSRSSEVFIHVLLPFEISKYCQAKVGSGRALYVGACRRYDFPSKTGFVEFMYACLKRSGKRRQENQSDRVNLFPI